MIDMCGVCHGGKSKEIIYSRSYRNGTEACCDEKVYCSLCPSILGSDCRKGCYRKLRSDSGSECGKCSDAEGICGKCVGGYTEISKQQSMILLFL